MAPTQQLLLVVVVVCCCSCRWACGYTSSSPGAVCAGSGVPVVLPEPLGFCNDVGPISCCDFAADAALRKEFEATNVPESDATCAAMVMAILCERCKPSPSPQPVNPVTIKSIPPRCGASQPPPPSPEKARIPGFVWAAASISIPGIPITGFAIYFFWSRGFGGSRGEEQGTGTATRCSFTWNCRFAWACCFCGNTNDGNNAPTGGHGGCQLADISAS